jgi:GTP-binding protein HflX
VLHPILKRTQNRQTRTADACLEEAIGLAEAIDLDIAGAEIVTVGRIDAGRFIGKGQAQRIDATLNALGDVDLVVMDTSLSPIQQRNLEEIWQTKVIDRTGLILEIFGARAQTREGRTQVELAALSYQRSRLVRSWTHLERQRGGFGFLGGPGESQLEIDRRLIDERMAKLKRALEKITQTRKTQRAGRKRVPYEIVALVGYTNAGKSTLFNRLTDSKVMAEDLLFATLDPTHRALKLPSGRNVVLSDTVGFISDLPTQLVAAFRATLEEVNQADLLLHVRDVSHPDTEAQCEDVMSVLTDIRDPEADIPIEVLNKIDLLPEGEKQAVQNAAARNKKGIPVSALNGEGCEYLLQYLDDVLTRFRSFHELKVDLADGAALAWLYRNGQVVSRADDQTHAHVSVALDASDFQRYSQKYT